MALSSGRGAKGSLQGRSQNPGHPGPGISGIKRPLCPTI